MFAHGKVVHEEEGACPLDEDVICAVGDEIRTHGVVDPSHKGDFQFCPDSVGAGDKDRILVVTPGGLKEASEPAGFRQDFRAERASDNLFYFYLRLVGAVDIDTSPGIGLLTRHEILRLTCDGLGGDTG